MRRLWVWFTLCIVAAALPMQTLSGTTTRFRVDMPKYAAGVRLLTSRPLTTAESVKAAGIGEGQIADNDTLNQGNYLFIELKKRIHFEAHHGTYPGPMIDSPTYNLDEKRGVLRAYGSSIQPDDPFIIILGTSTTVTGAGGGKENALYPVYNLPYKHAALEISELGSNSTLHLRYNGKKIRLGPGEEWAEKSQRVDSTSSGSALIETTTRIIHRGLFKKSGIESS